MGDGELLVCEAEEFPGSCIQKGRLLIIEVTGDEYKHFLSY